SIVFTTLLRPSPSLFPYTTLFRSRPLQPQGGSRQHGGYFSCSPRAGGKLGISGQSIPTHCLPGHARRAGAVASLCPLRLLSVWQDRKSTRLNSSHVKISYAVFCLK